jgi:hypothetical protein
MRAAKALSSSLQGLDMGNILPDKLITKDKSGVLHIASRGFKKLEAAIKVAQGDRLEALTALRDTTRFVVETQGGSLAPGKGPARPYRVPEIRTTEDLKKVRLPFEIEENDVTGKITSAKFVGDIGQPTIAEYVKDNILTSAKFNDFMDVMHKEMFGGEYGPSAGKGQVNFDRILREYWNKIKPESQHYRKQKLRAVGSYAANRKITERIRKIRSVRKWKEFSRFKKDAEKFYESIPITSLSRTKLTKLEEEQARKIFTDAQSTRTLDPIEGWSEARGPGRRMSREERELIQQLSPEMRELLKDFNPNAIPMVGGWLGHIGAQAWDGLTQVGQLSRTTLSTADASNPLRQTLLISVAHPMETAVRIGKMLRSATTEAAHQANMDSITNDPLYALAKLAGLNIPIAGKETFEYAGGDIIRKIAKEGISIEGHKIPGISQAAQLAAKVAQPITGRSENMYIYVQGDAMMKLYKNLYAKGEKMGVIGPHIPLNEQLTYLRDIATFVNVAGSRARIKDKKLKAVAEVGFFSPQMIKSRVEALADIVTFGGRYQNKAARKVIMTEYARGVSGVTALTALVYAGLKTAGFDPTVETDPRSSDFMKVRVGDTRIDTLGGFQQYVRFGTQFATGTRKETTTGQIKAAPRLDLIMRFTRTKMAPLPGAIYDTLKGSGVAGRKQKLHELFTPLGVSDVIEIGKKDKNLAAIMFLPIMLGIGAQSWQQGGNWRDFSEDIDVKARKVYAEIEKQGLRGPRPGKRVPLGGKDALGRANYYNLSKKEYETFSNDVMPKVMNVLNTYISSDSYQKASKEQQRRRLYNMIRKLNKRFGAAKRGGRKWIQGEPEPQGRWQNPVATKIGGE